MFLHVHIKDLKKYYKRLFGILSAVLSYFLFALSNVLSKFIKEIKIWEVLFIRQLVVLLIVTIYFLITKEIFEIYKTQKLRSHIFRGFSGYAQLALTLFAMLFLPLSEASCLSYTHGIFMIFLTPIFLKDKVSSILALYVFIGFIGVICIVNPSGDSFNITGCLLGLSAGIFLALSVLFVKSLSSTESIKTTIFYFSLITFGFSTIPILFTTSATWPTSDILYSIVTGIVATIGQIFLTISIFCISPTTTAVISYSSMIWTTILGYLIWNQIPSTNFYIGGALIIYAGIAGSTHKLKSARIKF